MGILHKSKSPSKSPSKTPPSQIPAHAPVARSQAAGVDHSNHDATAAKHNVPSAVTKFFVSSFDYIKAPHEPIHPAFTQWAKDAGAAYISVIWRELNGHTLPVAVTYEVKTGTRLDYLELSNDGKKFTHEHIADIVMDVEKHTLSKNKDILMLVEASSNNRRIVRGDLFKVKGGTTMFPSQDDPGVHLLTQGFTKDGNQSVWEVQNDKSLLISEQSGKHIVGIITAEDSVNGYIVQGPITFTNDAHSSAPETAREEFITHVVLALMIMPIHRPANMTKMLWWLRKLGGLALEGAGGL